MPSARRGPTPRTARAADEAEYAADHDEDVDEQLEHDTAFDGDDEHAPEHPTTRAPRRR